MIKCFLILATLCLQALPQTLAHPPKKTSDIIFAAPNAKYHLVCRFHGTIHKEGSLLMEGVSYVTVSDQRKGETVRLRPARGEAVASSLFYHEVWSPDSDWLVLPLGRFDGFQLIHAQNAMDELKRKQPTEFVRLEGPEAHGISTIFAGWTSPSSFQMTAGGEDLDRGWTFLFSLTDLSLRPKSSRDNSPVVSFVTAKGKTDLSAIAVRN